MEIPSVGTTQNCSTLHRANALRNILRETVSTGGSLSFMEHPFLTEANLVQTLVFESMDPAAFKRLQICPIL